MNLYIFPEAPVLDNGFGVGIAYAYNKLQPKEDDVVVWYTSKTDFPQLRKSHHIIKKPSATSFRRIMNVLRGKPSHELSPSQLSFLKGVDFDAVHCDDTTFFPTLRRMMPDKHIVVRFHNCYARIEDRQRLLNVPLSRKFRMVLKAYYQVERDIMNDRNSTKIFVTQEDMDYYRSNFGIASDSCVWVGEYDALRSPRTYHPVANVDKVVWFGGVESHKYNSVRWFIDKVFPQVKQKYPFLTFHLYGAGTQQFDNPAEGIFGHGFYEGNDVPGKGTSLYVNPDIIGSGIKLKLLTYLKEGVPFITTPFGFEGYSMQLADDYCIVSEQEHWVEDICRFIQSHNS
ncbi:MAG: glycosyltransferase [Prevotella sp.]|nr:glycosyltransferase [Prevotella sp.]